MTVFDRLRQLEANAIDGRWRTAHGPREFAVAVRNLWGPLVAVAEAAARQHPGKASKYAEGCGVCQALAALERAVKEQP